MEKNMDITLQDPAIQQAVDTVCQLMLVSAITAPKAKGESFVVARAISGAQVQELAQAMFAYGEKSGKSNYDRDGRNVAHSDAVLLVGLKNPNTLGLNCGACGYELCDEMLGAPHGASEFRGPVCAHRLVDLGIALGSAVKTAGMLNVDNRIMYRIGAAACQMGLVDWDIAYGVPLSVSGKSIYFDR
jgi:uncharacterized ferredoxin-like protein